MLNYTDLVLENGEGILEPKDVTQAQPKPYRTLSSPKKSGPATGKHTLESWSENLGFLHDLLQNFSTC